MKTLNDSLREEFKSILEAEEIKNKIINSELRIEVLVNAFNTLLDHKYRHEDNDLDSGRKALENYLINYFKIINFRNNAD